MQLVITGKGHENITAKHKTTIAFTQDKNITLNGDCFVAVDCEWEVTPSFLKKLRHSNQVVITIQCNGCNDTITGRGHPDLTLTDNDLVIRKSDWVDSRTLVVGADKSASDLNKELINELKKLVPVTIVITV